jgi:hypothetical protein
MFLLVKNVDLGIYRPTGCQWEVDSYDRMIGRRVSDTSLIYLCSHLTQQRRRNWVACRCQSLYPSYQSVFPRDRE